MLITSLRAIFRRDLEKLKAEILAYKDETRIWVTDGQIANSAGNLCLHLLGNLNAYLGAEYSGTGYVRDRPLEFSQKNVARTALTERIEQAISMVDAALATVQPAQLEEDYPQLVFAEKTSTEFFLVHLAVHLGYHLGQINYHRRLLDY